MSLRLLQTALAGRPPIATRISSLRIHNSNYGCIMKAPPNLERQSYPYRMLQERYFSDRLMGYSPMSPSAPRTESTAQKMPTAQEVSTAGSVWAPTSAKREKLGELRLALEDGQTTLDDAATPEQKLDLYLADGLHAIAKGTDEIPLRGEQCSVLREFKEWMQEHSKDLPDDLHQVQWNTYLTKVSQKATTLAAKYPAERCLRHVRDFYESKGEVGGIHESDVDGTLDAITEAYQTSAMRHRLDLVQAAADHLSHSWDTLTTVTDADVDRAAVKDISMEAKVSTLPLRKLHDVLQTFAGGTCSDRVSALWALLDRDEDGLLDQAEMDKVAYLAVSPIQNALEAMFEDALRASPVLAPLQENKIALSPAMTQTGWRASRRERRAQKRLLRLFRKTKKRHFEDEVEMPHRLRCIYAWAEKTHQNNQIDSIQLDASFGGRKRYVELEPKISIEEFRDVQKEHFTHLDRIEQEVLRSFRDDLLVDQGKGRQNRELRRDCFLFLTVVSVLDFIIISL